MRVNTSNASQGAKLATCHPNAHRVDPLLVRDTVSQCAAYFSADFATNALEHVRDVIRCRRRSPEGLIGEVISAASTVAEHNGSLTRSKMRGQHMPNSGNQVAKAAEVLMQSGIMTKADKAVIESIANFRGQRAEPRVLRQPGFLFTPSVHILGEHDDLRRLAPLAALELAKLEPWNGMSEGSIAELILADFSDTYSKLMFIGITLGVRLELGDTPARNQLSFERVDGFVSTLYERTFAEGVA